MAIRACVFDAYGTLYDVHSVVTTAEDAFPGHGELITQIWRLKQLEYAWLRCIMEQYADFRIVTRDSLNYTLAALGLQASATVLDRLLDAYDRLSPYPEATEALAGLAHCRRVILSNGSQPMLDALVGNTGLDRHLDAVISVDPVKAFKPDRRVYALVTERLGVSPAEVMFVTSNGFDVAGARSFGFNVARVVRVTQDALRQELTRPGPIDAPAFYRALRSQNEMLGQTPTVEVGSLLDLLQMTELRNFA